ncbi:hypothetical protein IWW36_003448 [Coemansia brasiliensis]|uniref:Proteasomal ATPase-associated factor 1 n=1 Tax=Coemansia brasiliensis TaxID=2650707 RepID=A0A9W8LYJ5_9FUNG|nr:hypothetical protein IWW36_003448 [Coemansia brasiliensis]
MQILGYISVQPDWCIDISNAHKGLEGEHKFWVSAYKPEHPSIHGSIDASSMETDVESITAEYVGPHQLRLACPSFDIPPTLFTAPTTTITCSHILRGTGVRSFDLSAYGGLLVAGGDDGVLDVYDVESSGHRVQLEGHLGDITCCRFFPSGQVVLSGAMDMQVKIWSAIDGTNPVTLTGHAGPITDIAIVGVGKTVLSAAKDGSVRLWHCGQASCLHAFDLSSMPINAMHLNTLLAVACEDGRAILLNVDDRQVVAELGAVGDPPVKAVAYDPEHDRLVTGLADGSVCVWSAKSSSRVPICSFSRGQSPIAALCLVQQPSGPPLVCVGAQDGQLFVVSLAGTADVVEDLVAFDVDPISHIKAIPSTSSGASRQSIWAAGQDSRICMF